MLVQKPFAWDRDEIMRALHCDYTKRADVLRDVEQALEDNSFTEEWDRLVLDNPCADDNLTVLNEAVGAVAKNILEDKHTHTHQI